MTRESESDDARRIDEDNPVGLLSVDSSGQILDANPALLRFLGSPSREATRKINVLTYPPLVQAGIAGDFRRAISQDTFVRSERDYTSKWGKTIRARLSILPVHDGEGKLLQVVALIEDRTASGAAENLLRIQRDLGLALASVGSLPAALGEILDAALEVEGVDCGALYLSEDGALRLAAHRRLPDRFVAAVARFGPEDPPSRLVSAGVPVFRRGPELGLTAAEPVREEGLKAVGVIPVSHNGTALAALVVASHLEEEIPGWARDALQAIAAHVGSVVARVRAEDDLRERERFLSLLSAITNRTLETDDVDEILAPLADQFVELFGCDDCYVTGWDEANQRTIPLAASGGGTAEFRSLSQEPGEATITRTALMNGGPVVVAETRSSGAISPRLANLFLSHTALGLPLVANGVRLGAIILAWHAPRSVTEREIAAGAQAAAQLSLALARRRLSPR